ncbi:hypothetical protein EDB86DRAFT_2917357 [Lactarius hatsudake]|nr:hypothetical protein EDB86DRAFT_2917357 [Lactarius hatsudake]
MQSRRGSPYLAAYKQSEHCKRVFKTPGRTSEMLRMSLTRPDPLHVTDLLLLVPSDSARKRPDAFEGPFHAWQERRYAPTNLPVVTMWANCSRGVSRRMGVGVNAVCSLNSISTPPFLALCQRVTMRHLSAGVRRAHGTSSSTRPQPWVIPG